MSIFFFPSFWECSKAIYSLKTIFCGRPQKRNLYSLKLISNFHFAHQHLCLNIFVETSHSECLQVKLGSYRFMCNIRRYLCTICKVAVPFHVAWAKWKVWWTPQSHQYSVLLVCNYSHFSGCVVQCDCGFNLNFTKDIEYIIYMLLWRLQVFYLFLKNLGRCTLLGEISIYSSCAESVLSQRGIEFWQVFSMIFFSLILLMQWIVMQKILIFY